MQSHPTAARYWEDAGRRRFRREMLADGFDVATVNAILKQAERVLGIDPVGEALERLHRCRRGAVNLQVTGSFVTRGTAEARRDREQRPER